MIGTNTCGSHPSVVPSKPRGATPTMVSVWPLTMICLLSTVGSRAEARLPVVVAEHHDRRFARRLCRRSSRAAGRAPAAAEHREIAAGHEHAVAAQRLAVDTPGWRRSRVRRDAVKTVCAFCKSRNIGIAEDVVAVARLAAGLRSGLRPGRAQVHELARIAAPAAAAAAAGGSSEKIAALAPMPSASETHRDGGDEGVLNSVLMANLRLRTTPSDETRGATVGSVRRQPREQGPMVRIPGDGGDLATVRRYRPVRNRPERAFISCRGRCVLRKSLAG